jgi:hypothetical protein
MHAADAFMMDTRASCWMMAAADRDMLRNQMLASALTINLE